MFGLFHSVRVGTTHYIAFSDQLLSLGWAFKKAMLAENRLEGDNNNSREVRQEATRLSRGSDKPAAEPAAGEVRSRTPVEAGLPRTHCRGGLVGKDGGFHHGAQPGPG